MKRANLAVLCLIMGACVHTGAEGQQAVSEVVGCSDPEVVMACQGDAILTQAALDGAVSRIPEDQRLMYMRDGANVDQMIKNLLRAEVIALDAEKQGFADDPVVRERVMLAARKELAEAWMEELVELAPEADYEAMAYEDYLAYPEKYSSAPTVDVTHILISTDSHTTGEAEELALELRSRLEQDPRQFDALVMEYSEDPGKEENQGKYTGVARGQLLKPFEEVAFSMDTPGEISQPVLTDYGYHLVRLDALQPAVLPPYEEVREEAIEKMKTEYKADYRANYLQALLLAPVQFPPGAVEVMVRRYFGEDLEQAPIFSEEGIIIPDDESEQP